MTAPSEHVKDVLVTAGVGNFGVATPSTGWRIGIGKLVETPDQLIILFDTGNAEHPMAQWLLDYPLVQIIVRGTQGGYQAAIHKARDVFDALIGVRPIVFGDGDRIDAITVLSQPAHMGQDKLDRPLISANYRLILEPAPSALTLREVL